MKKFFAMAMVAVMAAASLTGCGSTSSNNSSSSSDAETLVIGGTGPLTGDNATYGISCKNGATIAMEEINAAGGVNGVMFSVLYEDDQADPSLAVSAYNRLMDQGMQVCLGGVTSGACIAVNEETNKDGILSITPSASQKECVQYDNAFRICFQDPDLGTYAAEFMKEKNLTEAVAVLYDKSNDYSAGIYNAFQAKADEIGLNVVTVQAFTDQSNTDFSVQLQAVKDSGADTLFIPIYAQEAAYILTQAAALGLDVTFFGVDGLDGILEKIGEDNLALTEDVILVTPFIATAESSADFTAKYQEEFGMVPDQFAADAYDAVYAVAAAMEQAGVKPSDENFNEAMIAAMTQITVDGLTGTMTWTADGECQKDATAVVIKNGAYEVME